MCQIMDQNNEIQNIGDILVRRERHAQGVGGQVLYVKKTQKKQN